MINQPNIEIIYQSTIIVDKSIIVDQKANQSINQSINFLTIHTINQEPSINFYVTLFSQESKKNENTVYSICEVFNFHMESGYNFAKSFLKIILSNKKQNIFLV